MNASYSSARLSVWGDSPPTITWDLPGKRRGLERASVTVDHDGSDLTLIVGDPAVLRDLARAATEAAHALETCQREAAAS